MALVLYSAGPTLTTVLSTDLNSLASTSMSPLSTVISNDQASSERRTFCVARLTIAAQGAARSAGATVGLRLAWSIGGTDDSAQVECLDVVAWYRLDAATSARTVTRVFPINAPYDFRLAVENRTGQAFASSGNTLAVALFALEGV